MMATILNFSILNSAILDSAILHKTLTQTSSIWLKLIHSHSTWWYQPSWTLPCWIQTLPSWIQTLVIFSQIHSKTLLHSTLTLSQTNSIWLNLMMATILNSAILDSAILHKTLTQISSIFDFKLIHSHSTWWWQSSWTLPSWIQPFCTKRTSLIHSDSTWWWQPSWILPCWIQTLPSWIQTP